MQVAKRMRKAGIAIAEIFTVQSLLVQEPAVPVVVVVLLSEQESCDILCRCLLGCNRRLINFGI